MSYSMLPKGHTSTWNAGGKLSHWCIMKVLHADMAHRSLPHFLEGLIFGHQRAEQAAYIPWLPLQPLQSFPGSNNTHGLWCRVSYPDP